MDDIALVTPMAGRGVRFRRGGVRTPKPLVDLWGRPLFWWSTESVLRSMRVRELVFVVLAEHVERFGLDSRIREFYPTARVVPLAEATSGAAETAAVGVGALRTSGPFAVNDCDHAFRTAGLPPIIERLTGRVEGALLGFQADAPEYSYVRFDHAGKVLGTVEKQVVSNVAIAGCYLFAEPPLFLDRLAAYRESCAYDELFVSGVYNTILAGGGDVLIHELEHHVSFGTPEEHHRIRPEDLAFMGVGA
jgi:dTDP-glucose pyrophosphorylase